ncbi:hypothetical protein GQ457_10G009960 [Hibiscus cannabinus]
MLPGTLFFSPLSRGRGCLCAPFASFVATIGAWLWPPWELGLPLQHSRALRSPRLDVGLSRALRPPRLGVGLAAVLALLFDWQLIAVLAVGASWIPSCFASYSLTWCTSVELVLWTSRLRTIVRFFVCCAYGVALMIRPSQRPSCGLELAAVTDVCFEQSPKTATVGSHPRCTRPLSGCLRPTLGLLGAVSAAWFMLPPQATLATTVGSNPRGLLVSNFPCLRLVSWLLDSRLCDAGFVARLCVRLAACLAEWMTLERFGSMARPRYRFMTCSARYLFWARFRSPNLGLCRLPTSPRIESHSPYLFNPWCRFYHYILYSLRKALSPLPLADFFFFYFFSMADSLLVKLGDLTFTTEEHDAVVVAPESVAILAEDFESSLVGKVVSPPTVDGSRLIRQFRSIWKDDKVLNISEINPNFFLVSFAFPANRTNVLKRGPWEFQKYWFALEQADPNRTIHDYSFPHMCIWVRMHNIPLSLMTASLARVLGASIGKVIMTDTRLEDGNMGEFMRVRVMIDTSKPLRRCVVLSRPDAKASMCPLQYERLPLFCHGCSLIGHSVLACLTTSKVEGQKFQYGSWLRAPLPKRSATHPRGQLSIVDDNQDIPLSVDSVDSASDGPSTWPHGTTASASASASDPAVRNVAAPAVRTDPAVPNVAAPAVRTDHASALHIDVVITYDSSISLHFTVMHGRSESSLKQQNWALIDRLRGASQLPWLLGGDFNEILTLSEKQGEIMKSGPRVAPTQERLDRFIADKDWFLSFPTFRAWSEYSPNSDHHFILLDTVAPSIAPEAVAGIPSFVLTTVGLVSPNVSPWFNLFGPIPQRIPRLRSEINRLSSRRLSPEDLEVLLAAKGKLCHLLNVQEAYWVQRSRVLWLSAGDRNTSFFHAKASARKKKNVLMGLYDANGYWQTSTREVLRIASNYFVALFSANPPFVAPAFLEHITPSVTEDMNSGLLAAFTAEEVIAAFRDINPRKSPEIDGLPSGFFRQHWDILGEDFVSLCLDLLRGHADMASVNETIIVLIPKVDKPTSMRQLCPISLVKISTAPA